MRNSSSNATRPLPRTFVLELTRGCNHRCAHCYTVWGAPKLGYPPPGGRELSTAEWKKVIRRLQKQVPSLESLALSGGEPLLREDALEIVRFISDRGLSPLLITNGTLLDPGKIVELNAAGAYLEIPLLSYRPAVHDRLTGVPGSWDKVVNALADVAKAGGNWVCVFVATRLNCADLEKTISLAIALRAEGMMYNRVNLAAANFHQAQKLLPTVPMIRRNLASLEKATTRYGFPVAVSVVIEPCVLDAGDYPHVNLGWCPLGGERSYFTIDPGGNIRICNHSPTVLGNILEDDFTEIYRRHPYVRRFRRTWPEECRDCPDKMRKICGGGCKAAAEQCYGTITRVDPFVTLARPRQRATVRRRSGA